MENLNKDFYEKNVKSFNFFQKIESFMKDLNFTVSEEKPIYNPDQQNAERNFSIKNLQDFFEKNNFIISNPMSIKLEKATTLFVSAGIQKLENTIHKEDVFPETPLFINQPVLRSQFLGSKEIESYTSFHNITTIDVNVSISKHLDYFKKWIDFLLSSGFLKENFLLQIKETNPKIGNIKYQNFVIKVFYGGLEIGDAVFIPEISQKTRPSFSISDIGFGVERLEHDPKKIHSTETDCLKTLALLSISGIEPSNNNHGYRLRMFSKKLVSECGLNYSKMSSFLAKASEMIDMWLKYGYVGLITKEEAGRVIAIECQRNFNREILNFLKNTFNYLNEIDINQETLIFIKQLEDIGDMSKNFWLDIKKHLSINF
ncbi:MAG: hypothetical protein WC389_17575 [Lutibacter sp.]|jgi:alanyl-tRNA synthetase